MFQKLGIRQSVMASGLSTVPCLRRDGTQGRTRRAGLSTTRKSKELFVAPLDSSAVKKDVSFRLRTVTRLIKEALRFKRIAACTSPIDDLVSRGLLSEKALAKEYVARQKALENPLAIDNGHKSVEVVLRLLHCDTPVLEAVHCYFPGEDEPDLARAVLAETLSDHRQNECQIHVFHWLQDIDTRYLGQSWLSIQVGNQVLVLQSKQGVYHLGEWLDAREVLAEDESSKSRWGGGQWIDLQVFREGMLDALDKRDFSDFIGIGCREESVSGFGVTSYKLDIDKLQSASTPTLEQITDFTGSNDELRPSHYERFCVDVQKFKASYQTN